MKNRRGWGWVAAGLAITPLAACAHGATSSARYAPQPSATGGGPSLAVSRAAPRVVPVNDRVARTLLGRCVYHSSVRGTLREVGPAGAADQRLAPLLAVDARVRCPDVESEHLSRGTLAGVEMTPRQLARALGERASVVTVRDGRVCTVRPRFVVQRGGVTQESVGATCATPPGVGGGPRDGDAAGGFEERTTQSPHYGEVNRGVH